LDLFSDCTSCLSQKCITNIGDSTFAEHILFFAETARYVFKMVAIRKAKKRFQLRKRGGGAINQVDKEKMGLLIIGATMGFLIFVVSMGVFSADNEITESGALKNTIQKLRRKKHIELEDPIAHRPMNDAMNAVAQDIFEILGCEDLFKNKTDADDRRRLEEAVQQHGDDGGFEDMMEKVPDKNIQENNAEVSFEDWGKDAERVQAESTDDRGKDVKSVQAESTDDKWGKAAKLESRAFNTGGFDDGLEARWDDAGYDQVMDTSATHLFCLAASPNPPESLTELVKCDATNTKRKTLLDLWSAARAQIGDTKLLKEVLELTHERTEDLINKAYNLWAPTFDDGLRYVLNTLNSDNDADNGGILGLSESLGPGKLFVDVGSCLGLTTLAVSAKYPGTQIASIEPASPNWLMQEMNLRCNLEHDELKNIKVLLTGVGPNDNDEDIMMSKMLWRSKSTTSTRAWSPKDEDKNSFGEKEFELVVRLKKLRSVLAEADIYGPHTIDVMNIDCSGCEYNLIPALSDKEFDAIPTVMGGVHWGYIPISKLPSSTRAKTTHERLCRHENVAKRTKECCAFPDMPVQSSVPGEILVNDSTKGGLEKPARVIDVIMPGLCDDFDTWAKENLLFSVKDDWGWFQLSSSATV
jgi:FkbM family methyltransferase